MSRTLLTGAKVCTPDGILDPGWVSIDGSQIGDVGDGDPPRPCNAASEISLEGRWLLPGMVDIHVHGGGGGSFDSHDPDDVITAISFHREHGTTEMLASLVTAPLDHLMRSLGMLCELVDDGELAGVHLEGPFISSVQCGAQDPRYMIAPDRSIMERLLRAGRGSIRLVTIAPELPHSLDLIREIVDAGAIAAIGHTNATYEEAMVAIDAGARVATHLFNGMRAGHHRDPGAVLASIVRTEVHCELIVDCVHVHPAVVAKTIDCVGTDRVVSVTDATAAAGRPDGPLRLGERDVEVKDGIARMSDNGSLAGSTLTTSCALRHLVDDIGVDIVDAVTVSSATPASVLSASVGSRLVSGRIVVGALADLVVCRDDLDVDAVMRRGRWLTEADSPDTRVGGHRPVGGG